jgi:hypothetical protein
VTAQPIGCDICNAEIAQLLVSRLDNGDTLGVGAGCMYTWAQGLADAVKPPEPAGRTSAPAPESAGNDGEAGASKPPRRRRGPARLEVVPTGTDDQPEIVGADAPPTD